MGIQQGFCPICGSPAEGGICGRCRVEETTWITCEPRVENVQCPTCNATRQAAVWTDTTSDRAELARELAARAVHLHEEVRNAALDVTVEETSTNRSAATVSVSGTLHGVPVEQTCHILIVWKREQCPRCSRISGGYYEGVVQVRAKGRAPSLYEIDRASRIACNIERDLIEAGERLSFVSQMEESRDGLDIVVGTQHLGQLISQGITAELGGKFTTHPKLVGERDGKGLYRITFSIRLPFYQKGDVIYSDNHYLEVREAGTQSIRVFDLDVGTMRSIPEGKEARLIGNVRDAESTIVTHADRNLVGVLEPKTCIPREIVPVPWLPLESGSTVRVLVDPEREYLVPVG